MSKPIAPKRIAYTISEVAQMTGRDRTTVWRWMKSGTVKAVKFPGHHSRMISAASLERLLQGDRVG